MCVESTTGSGKAAKLAAADCLSFAAAPIFALMALLAGVFGGASGMHSSGMHGFYGLIDGMALMYLLMSVFHAAPWLTLLAIRRAAAARPARRADSRASRPRHPSPSIPPIRAEGRQPSHARKALGQAGRCARLPVTRAATSS
jgi:hypothetical protein